VLFSRSHNVTPPSCVVEGSVIPARDVAKCLGFWWRGDLLATTSVDKNIQKARGAFFHYGSIGVFQGDICPLSSRSVLECCVLPVLLYGCENWIITEVLWQKLESFQAGLVKRILRWPKHHSNTAALLTVDIPSVRSRVLVAKLGFLYKVVRSDPRSLSGQALFALSDGVDSLCIVKECRELEEQFGTTYTDEILGGRELSIKDMKKAIYQLDKEQLVAKCSVKAPIIAEVATRVGWSRLWDATLDLGCKSIKVYSTSAG